MARAREIACARYNTQPIECRSPEASAHLVLCFFFRCAFFEQFFCCCFDPFHKRIHNEEMKVASYALIAINSRCHWVVVEDGIAEPTLAETCNDIHFHINCSFNCIHFHFMDRYIPNRCYCRRRSFELVPRTRMRECARECVCVAHAIYNR